MTTTRVERGQPRGSAAEPASQPGVLMVVIEIKPEGEALLNQWYDEEHIADRLAVPGFRSIRRFKAADDSHRYLALWEVDNASLPMSAAYLNLPKTASATRWSELLRDTRVSVTRSAWVELPVPPPANTTSKPADTPPSGWVKQPGLFAVMMEIPAEHEDDFTRWYNEEHIYDLLSRPGWRSVRRLKALDEQKFIALWEVEDVRFQQRPDRDTRPQSAWTQRMNAYRTSVERTPWIELTVQVRSPSDGA